MAEESHKPTAFQKKLTEVNAKGMLSMTIAIGYKLRLFDALAKIATQDSPKSSREVADEADLRERLSSMACGNIIEVDKSGEKFWIPADRIQDLVHGPNTFPMTVMSQFIPLLAPAFEMLMFVFRNDGPPGLPYESYSDFNRVMNEFSNVLHGPHMMDQYLPLTGMKEKLQSGIMALDVGCGAGFHVCFFAEHFPKSQFMGIDISLDAVRSAMQSRSESGKGLHNAAFLRMDAEQLSPDWSDKFDWVTIFDACHDQKRPDLSLQEIYRVLKPGGVFTMLEINGSGNVYVDREKLDIMAAYLYSVSLFYCLPVGSDSKDAMCLGNMWGQERARAMLSTAGFKDVQAIPTPFSPINILYKCTK